MASRKPRPPMQTEDKGIVAPVEDEVHQQEMLERLDFLGRTLSEERSEAIRFRASSGIETDWYEDEEHYDGIDDANRDEHSSAWRTRPPGQATTKKKGRLQSKIFVNITRPAVNIAASRVANILMPRVNLAPTPVPELIGIAKGELPKLMLDQIADRFPGQPQEASDAAEQAVRSAMAVMEEAAAKAKKAQARIEDWYVEGRYYAENRLMIKDGAKIGTGVLKGPIPEKVRRTAYKDGKLIISEETKPVTRRIDSWNCFPATDCGENIQDGSYHWERDNITAKRLRALKDGDYLDEQIDLVIREGPMRAIAPRKNQKTWVEPRKGGSFEIWYRYGELTKENMEAAGCRCDDKTSVHALITMVNEHVIKVALNPLDNGAFPYDYFAWPQKRKGMPWGTGISRAGRTPQRICVAGVRAMMDNAGRSAGPQVIKGTQVLPNDGVNEIVPWKLWDYAEDGDIDDVRKAFAFVEVPMRQGELANIIQMAIKWMEESTNMPMLLQGQQGSAPDLVGVVQILNANASEFLRDLGSSYDDDVSEPHGRRYYDWLLQYGADDEKGEFVLDTRGASVNVERLLQDQELVKALQMSLNPVFKKDPAKFMDEYLTSRHFDPKKFDYDDEEWRQIVKNLSQPQDSRVAVEQMRAQAADQRLQREQQFEAAEGEKDRQVQIAVEMIESQMTTAELSSVERQVLEKLKAGLADTVIKVRAQKEMSAADIAHDKDVTIAGHAVDLHKSRQALKPPVEPRGKARPGKAFTQ